jgi:hypothetical protein
MKHAFVKAALGAAAAFFLVGSAQARDVRISIAIGGHDSYREVGYFGDERYAERRYARGPRWHRERGSTYGDLRYEFDEREYLRCNRDVRRAVYYGGMPSGRLHYLKHGRYEGRGLSC